MSKGTRTVIIVMGAVAAVCVVVCIAAYLVGSNLISRAVATQPEQAAAIGHEIADYTLPPGYAEVTGMALFGTKWVAIASESGKSPTFMLMQFPASSNMSEEEMRQAMEQAMARQGQRQGASFRVVGTRTVVIKGSEVVFTVSEGQAQSGISMRQMTGLFPGKGGLVMLMVIGEIAAWDDATVDTFLSSIR